MSGEPVRRDVTILDPVGFHLRPMTAFVQKAMQFQSTVTVINGDRHVNGKSPLELMLLGATQGTVLTLEARGPDARQALDALCELINTPPPAEEELPVPQQG